MSLNVFKYQEKEFRDLTLEASVRELIVVIKFVPQVEEEILDQERCLWRLTAIHDHKDILNTLASQYSEDNDHRLTTFRKLFEENPVEFKNRLAYKWLYRIVYSPQTQDAQTVNFYLDKIEKLGFKREQMVKQIIGDEQSGLSTYFIDNEHEEILNERIGFRGRQHLHRLARWFMTRRYDFATARWLINERLALDHDRKLVRFGRLVSVLIVIAFLICYGHDTAALWQGFQSQAVALQAYVHPGYANMWVAGVIVYAIVISGIIDVVIFRPKILLYSPRLLASLIIGYMPLLFTKDVWNLAMSVRWPLVLLLIMCLGIFSYLYLYFEVARLLGEGHARAIRRRSCRLFWQAGLASLLIGFFFMDLFAAHFSLRVVSPGELFIARGYFGVIPVKIYFLYAAMAIFFGIVLQTLWEDKPITEPL